jgi:Fe-S-cluster-containing hydrogenase component 2
MTRQIIKIDESKCNGCGLCVTACHEGAIGMEGGKARLLRDDYCDGLGDCLPVCPAGAITFEEREAAEYNEAAAKRRPQLTQWPVQIKLVPVNAPFFENANLLVAADCSAYAYSNFLREYMQKRITLIGCPKLDDVDYSEKLTAILKANSIKTVTVARMAVPCCGGIENAVKTALQNSGKMIPWQVVTISTDGNILDD